ncbi:ATP-dependent nuclease [Pseudarthrobacter siccitolerans]
MGLLLHILGGVHHVTLVDEPEAFLHPPQARRLGQVLAERTAGSQQVFMATHSSDVVQGALDSNAPVTIIRMTRTGDKNSASVLNSESVKELWSDPLLRYSNVLDGLFHDAVVLCESDSDCRYYAAVLDALRDEGGSQPSGTGVRRPQLLFTHCGGKARMASVVDSLRAAGVPVIVIADFDVLKNAPDVSRLITALGGQFSDVQADLNVISSALTSEVRPVSKIVVEDELHRRLNSISRANLTKSDMDSLRSILRVESGWDRAKRSGIDAIPQGDPSRRSATLLAALADLGLLVVPVGELERFVPAVAGHGPSWVTEVLRQGLHKSSGVAAREFIGSIEKLVGSRPA